MIWGEISLWGIPLASLVTAVVIFGLPDQARRKRFAVGLTGASVKIIFTGVLMMGVARGVVRELRIPFLPDFDLVFRADALALLFVGLAAFLWLVTTVYAHGYFKGTFHQNRFFGFFSLCILATSGIALAGNLLTLLMFYELLTLATYPLVVHRGTPAALSAGRVYLIYTLLAGAVLLLALVWLSALTGPTDFAGPGLDSELLKQYPVQLVVIFGLMVAGFGVKAAMVPLHGWLPLAMVAPAPVSALLHAVAVVKAGAFGIVRVVLDIYGAEFCRQSGVLPWLAGAAAVTILYGSLRALFEDDLKRRLAFSTVSQVSYIILGVAILGSSAVAGGIVHLAHQGIMKITLFFCAGNLGHCLGIDRVSRMSGVARRMPWTMGAFTVGAFGMIGVPPLAGFMSKWAMGTGALEVGQPWVIWILLASSVLNAGYFLPIVISAWFGTPDENGGSVPLAVKEWRDCWSLVAPPLITAGLTILMGVFAGLVFSPLGWVARSIVFQEYGF